MEKMLKLSEKENTNWIQIKNKMTSEMQLNVHKLLSKMPNKDRILFIKDFCKHFNEYITNKLTD